MKFDHLSDGEFEEFTYDLLLALGFVNVDWRRGSGLGGATADQGRDVVADESRKDLDGNAHLEKWFVQCKRYRRGVPPQELAGAMAWAEAERPSVLLIVVSNFLSNPAKSYLETYERNNRPLFRLKVWECKDLERLVSSYPALLRKYKLEPGDPAGSAHSAHLRYVLAPGMNTLDYFLGLLDDMDPDTRQRVFGSTIFFLINPRMREPRHERETMGELMMDPVDYDAFKRRCRELVKVRLFDGLLVEALVSNTLAWAFTLSNPADAHEALDRTKRVATAVAKKLEASTDGQERESLSRMVEQTNVMVESFDDRRAAVLRDYLYLCEDFLPKLELEEPLRLRDWRA